MAPLSLEQLLERVEVDDRGCWNWQQRITHDGYGRYGTRIRGKSFSWMAHRLFYEQVTGPIPHGLQIDHLCRNRRCCNPNHLEAVTPRENQLRGFSVSGLAARRTHCIHGHPLSGENLYHDVRRGWRACNTCRRAANSRATAKRRA